MTLSVELFEASPDGRCFVVGLDDALPPRFILVGFGTRRSGRALIARLRELPGPIDLAICTAPDASRCGGLVELGHLLAHDREASRPASLSIGSLWQNWLDARYGGQGQQLVPTSRIERSVPDWLPRIDDDLEGVMRGSRPSQFERAIVRGRWPLPAEWEGAVSILAPPDWSREAAIGPERTTRTMLRLYERHSIAVLIETVSGRLLFSGGASPADIVAGLDELEIAADRIDLLEVPMSGNTRWLDPAFFRRIRADHYVFPSPPTPGDVNAAEALLATREEDGFTVWPASDSRVSDLFAERGQHAQRTFRIESESKRLVFGGRAT